MIPRRHTPPRKLEEPRAADDAPLVETRFVDYDFSFGPKDTVAISLTEADTITELDDRWTVEYANGEHVDIFRASVRWVSRRERTVTTPSPVLGPTA